MTELVIKSKHLTAARVKNCLANPNVDRIVIHVSNDPVKNDKYVQYYKNVFSYSNVGRFVDVLAW